MLSANVSASIFCGSVIFLPPLSVSFVTGVPLSEKQPPSARWPLVGFLVVSYSNGIVAKQFKQGNMSGQGCDIEKIVPPDGLSLI